VLSRRDLLKRCAAALAGAAVVPILAKLPKAQRVFTKLDWQRSKLEAGVITRERFDEIVREFGKQPRVSVRVVNLDDSGAGSMRAAFNSTGDVKLSWDCGRIMGI
jgi:hypothetical protein